MRPLSLKLHNSKGIRLGLGLKDLEIDFTTFKPGLILFYGPTGSGKTTTLNSLNFNRPDFSANFDPEGYLELKALHKDHEYFAQIYESKASLFKDGELLNKTQKVSEYDRYVEKEFGDPKIFFKLMYAGRKFKNLLDSTSGEKKQLLMDYLLDYLKLYEEKYLPKLQDEYKGLIDKINFLKGKIANKENILRQIETLKDDIKLKELLLNSNREALVDLNKLQENYLLQEQESEKIKLGISNKKMELFNLTNKSESIQNNADFYNSKINEIRVEFDTINKELAKVSVDVSIAMWTKESLTKEINKYKDSIREIELEKIKLDHSCSRISDKIKSTKETLEKLEKTPVPCTSDLQVRCPAVQFKNIIELLIQGKNQLKEEQKELTKEEEKRDKVQSDIESEQRYLKGLENNILPKINSFEESKLKSKRKEELKLEANNLKNKLNPLEAELKDIKEKIINEQDLIGVLQFKIVEECQNKIDEINDVKIEIKVCEETIDSKNRELRNLNNSILQLENEENEVKNLIEEASEYPLLIEFFGKNGGVVFDLEQVGNEVSEIANKLLENYQNKKILLKFDTVYKNKEGKYIEDFNMSFSIDGSEWKTYLSDGESGIIANVIREAISYLDQKSQYKTTCVDEIDGSLDVKVKIDFIKLLEDGHKLNNRYYTFLISHSKTEVFPYIQQRIILEPENHRIRMEY